jgi:hypothetical protein
MEIFNSKNMNYTKEQIKKASKIANIDPLQAYKLLEVLSIAEKENGKESNGMWYYFVETALTAAITVLIVLILLK